MLGTRRQLSRSHRPPRQRITAATRHAIAPSVRAAGVPGHCGRNKQPIGLSYQAMAVPSGILNRELFTTPMPMECLKKITATPLRVVTLFRASLISSDDPNACEARAVCENGQCLASVGAALGEKGLVGAVSARFSARAKGSVAD